MDADFLIQPKNCLHKPLISGAAQAVILVKLDGTNLLDRLEFVSIYQMYFIYRD
jgi:hypothetical protein